MKSLFARINIVERSKKELIVRINPVLLHIITLLFTGLTLLFLLFIITIPSSITLSCSKSLSAVEDISCQLLSVNLLQIKTIK